MISLICTIRFNSLILALGMVSTLFVACGGSAHSPQAEPMTTRHENTNRSDAVKDGSGNGPGTLKFHFANKKSEAQMELDLNSTDVYLEMSGANAQDSLGNLNSKSSEKKGETASKSSGEPPSKGTKEKAAGDKSEPSPEEDPAANKEDITGKVLAGIRRAQELFYQKQYTQALEMVKQSLDAQPTAEGHALAGSIYYMLGQNKPARTQWQEALQLNPDMPAIVNMLKKTAGNRGQAAAKAKKASVALEESKGAEASPKAPEEAPPFAEPGPETSTPSTEAPKSESPKPEPAKGGK